MMINEVFWRNMSPEELEQFAVTIFTHYRSNGFPYYNLSFKEKQKEYVKLDSYDRSGLIQDGIVKQTMHGLGLAWHYFPHAFEVRCNNLRTPMEIYQDDELFMKAIRRRLKRGTYISDSEMRKALRSYTGTQGVSNFRPTAAAAIYDRYAGGGKVLDMSAGYGGRLLGAIISDRVKLYGGFEPCEATIKGLRALRHDFNLDKQVSLIQMPFENWEPMPTYDNETFDLCFTSPPYFNQEKYSDELTQSYIKFPTVEKWNEGFLRKMIATCYLVLKKEGYLILNVADTKSHPTLCEDTKRYAQKEGFRFTEELRLALSHISKGGYKYEPIYVFKKE